MIRSAVLEYGSLAQIVLNYKHGNIIAVFDNSVYLNGGDSLCCLGVESLVNGPVNIRTRLSNLSALRVGDTWSYTNNRLTLGQLYNCDNTKARLWSLPAKVSLSRTLNPGPAFTDCITLIESRLLAEGHIRNTLPGVTNSLTLQRLNYYQTLIAKSLLSPGETEQYTVPSELTGLLGCGDGLTPAGDDILLGVLIAAFHFDLPKLADCLVTWLKQHAEINTSQISYAHLLAACEGQAIEHLHAMLNLLTIRMNRSDLNTEGSLKDQTEKVQPIKSQLEQAIGTLIQHGHSSGYYTLCGVLLVLKHLAGTTLKKS